MSIAAHPPPRAILVSDHKTPPRSIFPFGRISLHFRFPLFFFGLFAFACIIGGARVRSEVKRKKKKKKSGRRWSSRVFFTRFTQPRKLEKKCAHRHLIEPPTFQTSSFPSFASKSHFITPLASIVPPNFSFSLLPKKCVK